MRLYGAGNALALAALAASCCVDAAEVIVGEEIFASQGAADLVIEARRHDPRFSRQADREKAASLYEKAIDLQPGAKINAALAERIAQLRAHSEGMNGQARAAPSTAVPWWKRCIALSNRKQLLWAQAHMGLGCSLVASGERKEAAAAFRAVLDLDGDHIEWPEWVVKPNMALDSGRRYFDEEMARIRRNAEEIKIKAVDLIHYVGPRAERATVLLEIAAQYKGTRAGARALVLAQKVAEEPGPPKRAK